MEICDCIRELLYAISLVIQRKIIFFNSFKAMKELFLVFLFHEKFKAKSSPQMLEIPGGK